MNYISRLQSERDAAHRELAAVRAGLDSLRAYLASPKFRCGDRLDGYVNTGDVLAYLRNAEDAGLTAREGGAL